jgi:hypothetical protein
MGPLTDAERELLGNVLEWLLDQDHDTVEGDYLWFLVPDVPRDPTDEQLADVREKLNSILNKLNGKAF